MAHNDQNNEEIHIEDDDAKAGETSGHMRWVLGIGLLLAVIAMSLIWIVPAAMQGDAEEEATVTGKTEAVVDDNPDMNAAEVAEDIAGDEDPLAVGDEAPAGETFPEQ